MLSAKTKQLLTSYFLKLSEIESSTEGIKESLCCQEEFEPYSYFKYLSGQGDLLTLDHLSQFTTKFKQTIRVQGLVGVILAHDTDHDGAIHYNDFLRMIIPNDNPTIRQSVALREKYLMREDVQEINIEFYRLILEESRQQLELLEMREHLQKEYDFDIYDAFKSIDQKKLGYIDYNQIRTFVLQNNPCQKDFDIQSTVIFLLRRLAKNMPVQQITYEMFTQHLKSQENYIQQFSPDRLERQKKESSNANKMYSLYGRFIAPNEVRKQSKLLSGMITPTKRGNTFNMNSSQLSIRNSQVNQTPKQSSCYKTPNKSPNRRFSPIPEKVTPVRLTNKKAPHKKLLLFDKNMNFSANIPLRYSPLQVSKNPNFEKKYNPNKTQPIKTSYFLKPQSFLKSASKTDSKFKADSQQSTAIKQSLRKTTITSTRSSQVTKPYL